MLVPLVAAVRVIQLFVLTTAQLHPAMAVTETSPVSPPAPWLRFVGVRVKMQGAPDCARVNVVPAMTRNPVRGRLVGFVSTA